MCRRANYLLYALLAGFINCLLLFSACTNDLKKIREISAKQVNSPADTTRGVDMIFSDSAKVKTQITAPLMLEYQVSKEIKEEYKLLPKGVKVVFFDTQTHKETGNIIADTAYFYVAKKVVHLKKNVVVTSAKGDVFKSEELNWDMVTHKINTFKPFDATRANGDIGHGEALETNEKFEPYKVKKQTGTFIFNHQLDQ
ncbi:MAG: LPS export ABC transporter periplasmic protein LptC [Bacteroidota bacterium]